MGSRGPVPKRSEERAGHRAKADRPDRVTVPANVRPPPASGKWHPTARRWYRSLQQSGQAQFFEPSDWEYARVLAELLTDELGYVKVREQIDEATGEKTVFLAKRRSSEMVKAILSSMDNLGTTEAARRRMRVEILRPVGPTKADDAKVAILDQHRRLAEGG